jgi:hypothetical protein
MARAALAAFSPPRVVVGCSGLRLLCEDRRAAQTERQSKRQPNQY